MNNSEGKTQEPVGGNGETFEDYMRNARNAFVKTITDYFPHEGYQRYGEGGNKIRVAAEDILICFDQMRERLLPPPKSSTGGLPKLDKPILDDDDVKGIIESSTEEEKDLWGDVRRIVIKHFASYNYPDQCISELQSTYKIFKR